MSMATQAIACPFCGSTKFIKWGLSATGSQRLRCMGCNKKSSEFENLFVRKERAKLNSAREVNFLVAMGKHISIRESARIAGISVGKARRIIGATGFVRRCASCGASLDSGDNRFLYCSDDCQQWRGRVYDGSANVLRYVEDNGCSDHVKLAIEIATGISERNMDLYLGPVYEGLEEAHRNGIIDTAALRKIGIQSVKKHWKEIQTFGAASLDAMKEATGFEWADS